MQLMGPGDASLLGNADPARAAQFMQRSMDALGYSNTDIALGALGLWGLSWPQVRRPTARGGHRRRRGPRAWPDSPRAANSFSHPLYNYSIRASAKAVAGLRLRPRLLGPHMLINRTH
jgi:hypothetical protein